MAVHPDLRGKGVGGAMMRILLDHPAVRGTVRFLRARNDQEFCASMGFIPDPPVPMTHRSLCVRQDKQRRMFTATPQTLHLGVLDDAPPGGIQRRDLDGDAVLEIQRLLRPRECTALIAAAEGLGFAPAGLAMGNGVYRVNDKARNNQRVIVDDRQTAALLWGRMGSLLPRMDRRDPTGVNWRFRIYRYQAGQYFRPHVDVRMDLPGGGVTLMSMMIYLNDDFQGGETGFLEKKPRTSGRSRKRNNRTRFQVAPVTGSAVVFDHLVLHEGVEVSEGVKYAVRTDVIFGAR
ncbi:MAG: prolyl 4-hydroxylase [Myxococcota bacterium]